jgi:hypothetical protein
MSKLKFELRVETCEGALKEEACGAIPRRCSRGGRGGGDLKAANRTYEKRALSVVCGQLFKIGLEARRLLPQTMHNLLLTAEEALPSLPAHAVARVFEDDAARG